MGQDVRSPRGPRCIALVGPFQSGKTTLLEAILARTGAIKTAGSVDAGTSVGDASPEARQHKMGVGLTAATTTFMGDSYTFIDCPGSIEFAHDMRAALPAVDAAVVVCEADEKKLPQLQIILRELEELGIPRFLFLNKIDRANKRVRETLATLQPDRVKNASGLFNLMRNLGGAVGLAVINEVLNDRTDLHISRLQDRVTWGNTMAVETLNNFAQRLQGMGDSTLMAMKQLSQLVHRQAAVMGYGDAFFMLSLFYVALSLLVLFVNKPPSMAAGGGDAH